MAGKVSGLVTAGGGYSFYIKDAFRITDNGGQGVKVTSRFPAPAGLANGCLVTLEGIAEVARASGRQIEVVADGKIIVAN